ncbi:SDR family oxidoreductase [Thalassobacillus sp. CUG 92003]|uniref:SDR family oxidoreductase n=1 Tax=Thalassobacillus sp. CUG 92003 TaxID=2736641 RepID=UPI0015E7A4D8|nr:SDR family oxidoreductase [Thalassobacillus sp. CUG 92003]
MRVLVIGANGKVGQHIVKKLYDSEHEPVAMVRDTDQVPQFEELGVSVVLGDLDKDIESAYYGIDAVLFAAGSGPHTGADKTVIIDQEGAIKAIKQAQQFGVKRFIMLSTMGANHPESGPEGFRHYLFAKHRADEYLKDSGLNYTIVRPGILTNEPGTGKISLAEQLDENGTVPREDVAETMVYLLSVPRAEHGSFDLLSGQQQLGEVLSY